LLNNLFDFFDKQRPDSMSGLCLMACRKNILK